METAPHSALPKQWASACKSVDFCSISQSINENNRQFGNELVDLFVGPQKYLFRVHKERLCSIPYFKKMFKGEFKEARENSATFPEDCADAFDLLMVWIYTKDLPDMHEASEDKTLNERLLHARCQLYALAEKIGLPELADYTINKLVLDSETNDSYFQPSAETVHLVYRITRYDSPLRRLMSLLLYSYMKYEHESVSDIARHFTTIFVGGFTEDMFGDLLKVLRNQDDYYRSGLTKIQDFLGAKTDVLTCVYCTHMLKARDAHSQTTRTKEKHLLGYHI